MENSIAIAIGSLGNISVSLSEGGNGEFGVYCRNLDYNWCSRLDEGLSSADYDNNANGVNYWYRHFYPKCLDHTDLKRDEMVRVEKNKTLDIFECGAHCTFSLYFLMKVRLYLLTRAAFGVGGDTHLTLSGNLSGR